MKLCTCDREKDVIKFLFEKFPVISSKHMQETFKRWNKIVNITGLGSQSRGGSLTFLALKLELES